jgi:CIC family chloride channel protein
VLAILALIVGQASGFLGVLFLLSLERADRLRNVIIVWSHSKPFAGLLVVSIVCAAAAAIAAWLVSRFSHHASGSGIPTRSGPGRATAAGTVPNHTSDLLVAFWRLAQTWR